MNNLKNIISGFIGILEGLIRVFSLGFYCPKLELYYWNWITEEDEDYTNLKWVNQNTKLPDVLDVVMEDDEYVSLCCGASMKVGGEGSTHYFICEECGKVCDSIVKRS